MKSVTMFFAALIFAACFTLTAFAAFATELNPGSTVIDFSVFAEDAKGWLYGVLAFLALLAYGLLQKIPLFNKLVTREQYQKLIDPLLDEAVAYGVGKLKNADWLKVDTKNEAIAGAAQYAFDHGGDLLKKFGISEDALLEKIEAKLVANGWDVQPGKWDA